MHTKSTVWWFIVWSQSWMPIARSEKPPLHNANHLFNAIHSSARQWGSSINHNGMSVFLATVPAGTQLYHGTSSADSVRGLEWLAYEPEHALIFARPTYRPPGHGGRDTSEEIDGFSENGATEFSAGPDAEQSKAQLHHKIEIQQALSEETHARRFGVEERHPLDPITSQSNASVGYLHTYAPRHDLHLLYVDGLSAGKTSNGTLDSQDMLILNFTTNPDGPFAGEVKRARGMCEFASTLWEGKIDGIMRMEGGFEIILCDFEKHVERTDLVAIKPHNYFTGMLGDWAYMRAITARYGGIGGGRVTLDYDNFVSMFAYTHINHLFENDVQSDYPMPRLQNVDRAELARVRMDITDMILQKDWDVHMSLKNWRTGADVVVARYSEPLQYLHTDKQIRMDQEAFEDYLANLLRPFIDYTNRSSTREVRRCVAQIVPTHSGASLAHRTVHTIAYHICDTLLAALSAISSDTPDRSIHLIDALVEYLRWTTWKDCGGCPDNEICYIPIWPMGMHEDHAHPRCRSEADARARWGYWGWLGPPPPKEGENAENEEL